MTKLYVSFDVSAAPLCKVGLTLSDYLLAFYIEAAGDMEKTFWRKIRFLTTGWWIIHLAGVGVVYALGHFLW
jgi:hypothetical protein